MKSLLIRTGQFLVAAYMIMAMSSQALPQISAKVPAGMPARVKVTATIRPLHSIAARIMKGIATPSLLLSQNQSTHYATLKPSQAKMLAGSDIVFWIGRDLETFLVKPLDALADKSKVISIIDVARLELLQYSDGRNDPHIWLSTGNAVSMAKLIRDQLASVDPANSRSYNKNLMQFENELENLRYELQNMLALAKSKKYLIYHDALRYFEEQFAINARSVSIGNEELTPSAKQITHIRKLARSGEYQCIFIEPGINASAIKSAAADTALRVATLDPVGTHINAGPNQYSDMMRGLAETIANCSK